MRRLKSIIVFIICVFISLVASAKENTFFSPDDIEKEYKNYFEHSTSFTDIIKCRGIELKNEKLVFYIDGDKKQIQLNVRTIPLNATNRDFTYISADTSIISVDENGLITSMNKGGKTKIKVECDGAFDEFDVEVIKAAEGVKLSRQDMLFYIDQYASAPLKAEVLPSDATNKKVHWKSSDTAVAYVDENGVVSPVGTGSAKVIATTDDGGFKAECTIYVKIANPPYKALFITNAPDCMRVGEKYNLKTYTYPQNSENLIWQSSNESVVSIHNGQMSALSEGMSMISVSTGDGREDYFNIVVYAENEQISPKIISQSVEERLSSVQMPVSYSKSRYTLDEAISMQMNVSPTTFTSNAKKATRDEVVKYMDTKNLNTEYGRYQFLDLRNTNGISEDRLNKYLSDKGILKGKANVFIDASRTSGISEIYLAVHSVHESGNGTSELALGVMHKGKKVYNLFGIGAYDEDPVGGGAEYAYNEGWTSIDKAIYGAARWISKHYINSGQNTLYKMRWNPSKPGTNQYATDVAWAQKQASVLKSLVEGVDGDKSFDMSLYKGDGEMIIRYE